MAERGLRLGALVGVGLAAACGQAGADGVGNGVLHVDCEVFYSPVHNLSRAAHADESLVTARVSRGGQPLPDAQISLVDLDGQEHFALTGAGGDFAGRWAGYRRRLGLEVRDGDDFVRSELTGPERHLVTEPTAGALHPSGRRLTVAWKKDPADTRAGEDADRTDCALAGGFMATTLRPEKSVEVPADQLGPGAQSVELVRHREQAPQGAAPGSLFRISYGVVVPFVVD